jgi:hypothetical protein
MKKTFFHGEAIINKVSELPKGLKKVNLFDKKSYKLVDSEVTGNFHLLEAKEGVELFEDSNGVLWLKNDVPTDVFCVIKERHDNITLEPGIWEIDKAKEYDYLQEMKRDVSD